jgi:hypothetical protein
MSSRIAVEAGRDVVFEIGVSPKVLAEGDPNLGRARATGTEGAFLELTHDVMLGPESSQAGGAQFS